MKFFSSTVSLSPYRQRTKFFPSASGECDGDMRNCRKLCTRVVLAATDENYFRSATTQFHIMIVFMFYFILSRNAFRIAMSSCLLGRYHCISKEKGKRVWQKKCTKISLVIVGVLSLLKSFSSFSAATQQQQRSMMRGFSGRFHRKKGEEKFYSWIFSNQSSEMTTTNGRWWNVNGSKIFLCDLNFFLAVISNLAGTRIFRSNYAVWECNECTL